MIYLDTHVVAWLFATAGEMLSPAARTAIDEADDIRISPMVRLELQYLYEIGCVTEAAAIVLDRLCPALGITVCETSFVSVVHAAESLAWTRDPFDRLIVAQAALREAPLVTKDGVLHANYRRCVW